MDGSSVPLVRAVYPDMKRVRIFMTTKSLLFAGTLALASLTTAEAKTYDITLDAAAQAGSVQLPAGEYKVKLEGTNAVFTDMKTSKDYTAPVKVENMARKFNQTAVETTNQGGTPRIEAIDLGGSTTKLEFGE